MMVHIPIVSKEEFQRISSQKEICRNKCVECQGDYTEED